MSDENVISKTLSKNTIKSFILRIDLIKNDNLNIQKIVEKLAPIFDRAEQRKIQGLEFSFTKGHSEVKQQNVFDFVLISEAKALTMTFSQTMQAFWIESSQYRDNSLYKEIINKTIDCISEVCGNVDSKRIGLRYINEFKCEKQKNLSLIFGKRLSSIIKLMISGYNKSRVISVEEYNDDGYKIRMQYGVPNKFYPSQITVLDLILDIDAFIENTNSIRDWDEVIKKLNHNAYNKFIAEINPKYLKELK